MTVINVKVLPADTVRVGVSAASSVNVRLPAQIVKGGDYQLPAATAETLGGVKVGRNLTIDNSGVLSVDTADAAQQDNTRPITSAAVYTQIGNIEALLALI